ncbi:MAG: hypothetical protein AAGA54_20745 [Myxococcota bacterium]
MQRPSKPSVRGCCIALLLCTACAPALGWRGGQPLDAQVYIHSDTTTVTVRRRGADVSPHLCFEASAQLQASLDGRPMMQRHAGGSTADGLTSSGLPRTACASARYVLHGSVPPNFAIEFREGRTVRARIRVKDHERWTCGGFGRCSVHHGARPFFEP